MNFPPDGVTELPAGQHKRALCCVALVGKSSVPIRWAVKAMQIAFPVNATRALFCLAHDNLDVSRNLTLYHWQRTLPDAPDGRLAWIALIPPDEAPWDVVLRGVLADVPVARLGNCYVIRRDALTSNSPWFVGGSWQHGEVVDLAAEDVAARTTVAQGVPSPIVAESAEQVAGKTIAVCIPSLGTTTMPWVAHAMNLTGPMTGSRALVLAIGHEVGIARQQLVDAVLGMSPRPEYMLFYGDDMLPPVSGLMSLFETMRAKNADAVAGLYYMKMYPPANPIIWRLGIAGPLQPGIDFQLGDVIEVDGTGLDFVLFRTSALAAMPALRFKTVLEFRDGRGIFMETEDSFFWSRWRETHGRGPLVDTRVRVGHYSAADGGVY